MMSKFAFKEWQIIGEVMLGWYYMDGLVLGKKNRIGDTEYTKSLV